MRAAIGIVPDLLRLVGRLARTPEVPRPARAALWLLAGYLASPIDLVPDVIPVVGYADDVIVAGLVLRWVMRRTPAEIVRAAWPGTPDGLRTLERLTRTSL